MSLTSIVNRFSDLSDASCHCFQVIASGTGIVSGAILKATNRKLSGALIGSGIFLGVQSFVQCMRASDDPNFRLNCKRISYLALATLTCGVAWGMDATTPLEERGFGNGVFLGLSFIASEVLAHGEDLEKIWWSADSETLTNRDISQTE